MKHITHGHRTLFVTDDAADALLEYAAALAEHGHAGTVALEAVGPDGNETTVTFLLTSGTTLIAESTNSRMTPPDNKKAIENMRERTLRLMAPAPVQPEHTPSPSYSFIDGAY